MAGRPSQHLVIRLSVIALALAPAAAGCGSDGDKALSDDELFGNTTASGASPAGNGIDGRFDVGDHRLYMACRGTGSPTVVYLHGSVRDERDGGGATAGEIPALLEDRHRVCVYDRANVGRSDSVAGPLTGTDSAEDLHSLLAAAGVRRPYVLLGGSLGGAIADLYAAKYPRDVVGMVLLDSTLPAYLAMYKRLYPPGSGPLPGQWRSEAEKLDRLATFREAGRIQGRRPNMPVTYIATTLSLPRKIATTIRRAQRAFVNRFAPGRLIMVDVPHYMQPVIPERIAREVERVIASAERRGS